MRRALLPAALVILAACSDDPATAPGIAHHRPMPSAADAPAPPARAVPTPACSGPAPFLAPRSGAPSWCR